MKAEKWGKRDSTESKRQREKESGGLELDEGHISARWAGNSEKALGYCKKKQSKP